MRTEVRRDARPLGPRKAQRRTDHENHSGHSGHLLHDSAEYAVIGPGVKRLCAGGWPSADKHFSHYDSTIGDRAQGGGVLAISN